MPHLSCSAGKQRKPKSEIIMGAEGISNRRKPGTDQGRATPVIFFQAGFRVLFFLQAFQVLLPVS